MVWGWIEWAHARKTPKQCVGSGVLNPVTLSLVWLVLVTVCAPCCLCYSLSRGLSEDVIREEQREGALGVSGYFAEFALARH